MAMKGGVVLWLTVTDGYHDFPRVSHVLGQRGLARENESTERPFGL